VISPPSPAKRPTALGVQASRCNRRQLSRVTRVIPAGARARTTTFVPSRLMDVISGCAGGAAASFVVSDRAAPAQQTPAANAYKIDFLIVSPPWVQLVHRFVSSVDVAAEEFDEEILQADRKYLNPDVAEPRNPSSSLPSVNRTTALTTGPACRLWTAPGMVKLAGGSSPSNITCTRRVWFNKSSSRADIARRPPWITPT